MIAPQVYDIEQQPPPQYTDGLPESYLLYLRQVVEAREEFEQEERRRSELFQKRFTYVEPVQVKEKNNGQQLDIK